MRKIIFLVLGLFGLISSIFGFVRWFPQWLGAGGAIAPELTVSQIKRLDELSSQASYWLLFFLVIFIVSLILFVWGVKQNIKKDD